MKSFLTSLFLVLFVVTAAGAQACEPCDDPSQLWCPDEW